MDSWRREIGAVWRKEVATELRGKTGLVTAGVFALCVVVTLALAFFDKNPNRNGLPDVAAAVLWIAGTFSALLSIPRAFLAEEEGGTMDLMRQWARPHAVYWGKLLFNLAQTILLVSATTGLFVVLTGLRVREPGLLALGSLAGAAALAGTGTLCGALAAPAANRAALAATVAVPLLLPLLFLLTSFTRVAFGSGSLSGGWTTMIGAACFAALSLATGPPLFALVWKG